MIFPPITNDIEIVLFFFYLFFYRSIDAVICLESVLFDGDLFPIKSQRKTSSFPQLSEEKLTDSVVTQIELKDSLF